MINNKWQVCSKASMWMATKDEVALVRFNV